MKSKLIFGFHAVTARLRHDPSSVDEIYVDAGRHDRRMQDLIRAAEAAKVRIIHAEDHRLDGMAGTRRHQGVVALADENQLAVDIDEVLDMLEDKGQTPLLLILDGVTDPHNLGACLRTADAAGVHAVIAPRDNIPVVSWLLLKGRCRSCGEPIPAGYPIVELTNGALHALERRAPPH